MGRGTKAKLRAGAALLAVVLALGALARTGLVTSADLHADTDLSHLRFGAATAVAKGLTDAAQETAGLGVLALVAVIFWVRRRRWDAAVAIAVAGAAWTAAEAIKVIISRPRPPSRLWLVAPDSSASFPSGHDVTATVVFVLVAMLAWRTGVLRKTAIAAGLVFTAGVGASRLYLGDHYPTDVLGSVLTVTAATLLVWAVTDLAWFRRLAARVLRAPEATPLPPVPPHPRRYHSAGAGAPGPGSHARRPTGLPAATPSASSNATRRTLEPRPGSWRP